MKKWLIVILAVFLLLLVAIYIFIPNFISINQNITISANNQGLIRKLSDESTWTMWWPERHASRDGDSNAGLRYNDNKYTIKEKGISSLIISISQQDFSVLSSLILFGEKLDSTRLIWEARVPTSYNPLRRLRLYLHARALNRDMQAMLEKMNSYFSKPETIYGFEIRKASVVDSTLISTFRVSAGYPGAEFIYGLIDELKKYISIHLAKETGFPMLNLTTTDSLNYLVRVAIPVDRVLPSSGNITYKWMLGGGNILITEVRGGPHAIAEASRQMEHYMSDYQRLAPAIPFLSLVTDRRQEPDTNKWITRLYYPVM